MTFLNIYFDSPYELHLAPNVKCDLCDFELRCSEDSCEKDVAKVSSCIHVRLNHRHYKFTVPVIDSDKSYMAVPMQNRD